ncbi:MAG: hypothetical protein SPL10_07545 [Synergistales bacterium]|nr:hypothetical protein [Synergistales bacterium]MDY6401359.1 hypothetical protein [Synergistales bacterium]MDY6405207.1 hypothetical protein [Synergistales bacterium]MDY6410023.1 hypothetical protein [Synergistales bacterium]MDY6414993.1 hypothetical protein [Synergistales bacterium]
MSGVKIFRDKIKIYLTVSVLLIFFSGSSQAVERLTMTPNGAVLYGARTYSGVVMAAYQRAYAMNFEIWKPQDLPAGWYATFDGFPVAQIAENRWVYGQLGLDGAIRPTNVLVGSVVPSNVPGLVRIASVWSYGRYLDSKEFLVIRDYRCNRMGWLDLDKYHASTLIAWNTDRVGVWLWLGNRWKRFTPNPGEYTWQMLKRLTPYVSEELRKANAWYQGGEPFEVADLARQWGFIWSGKVILESLKNYHHESGGSDANVTSMKDSASSEESSTTPQETQNNNSNTQWDVD